MSRPRKDGVKWSEGAIAALRAGRLADPPKSIGELSRELMISKNSIARQIGRMVDIPALPTPIRTSDKPKAPTSPLRAGAVTLPPLASLRDDA